MFQEILKVSVRKVTLTVSGRCSAAIATSKVVAFFTDAAAMDKVLNGMGSSELADDRHGHGLGLGQRLVAADAHDAGRPAPRRARRQPMSAARKPGSRSSRS